MAQIVHVISHTHWDREWYRPYQVFRARLVDVVDAVLDILENNAEYRYFHLDGQTIVLDDYLEIRPEREAILKRLIGEGRLLVGPWYTQPDEFLVSGEALVRNLLFGRRAASSFGGCMDIGYLPDSFGHAGQMPQIYAGFGFKAAVVFRGITADQVHNTFLWRGSDGTSLLTIKLPDDDAYSNYQYRLLATLSDSLPIDYTRLDAELAQLITDCKSTAVCNQMLWMDGVDHIYPNRKTPEIIAYANRTLTGVHVEHSTLPAFVQALNDSAPTLQVQSGELRHANRAWRLQAVLANVASSHIEIKQANTRAQNALERVVEPLAALAWLNGMPYPRTYLNQAWQLLMQNHAHDSICGCSVDQVHRDMHYRFDQVELIAGVLKDRALTTLAKQVDTRFAESSDVVLLVYNPSASKRDGVCVIEAPLSQDVQGSPLQIRDVGGNLIPHQVLEVTESNRLQQPRYDIPRIDRRCVYRIALQTKLPAFGFSAFTVSASSLPIPSQATLFTGLQTMENRYLTASIAEDGTLVLWEKLTGRTYSGLLAFEDCGDGGEGWNWIPPQNDVIIGSGGRPFTVSRVHDGALMATLRLSSSLRVPTGFVGAAHEHDPLQMKRNTDLVDLPIVIDISLGLDAQQVDITLTVENMARNHRLRVLFPTDLQTDVCYADGAFDVVERPIKQVDSHDWREPQLGTYPHTSFVAVQNDEGGLAVVTTGTHEYEVKDESRRTIAVTLFRAFGRGPGEPHEYIDSQELGSHSYRFAVAPYSGSWEQAGVVQMSRQFGQSPLSIVTDSHSGVLAADQSLLIVEGKSIDVTAVKRAEDRDSLILRLVNLDTTAQRVRIQIASRCREAYLVSLAEERLQSLPLVSEHEIEVEAAVRQILTLEIVPV